MDNYKQKCKQIKEQINPSDEFMQNLKENLNKRMVEEKMKRQKFLSKVAVIFVTVTLVSSGAFAMDIGNWLAQIFSNTDESMKIAVENGYVQNVDTEYIEHDGIAIKVNSLVIDDNKINIVFDVKGEIDGDLAINNLSLSAEDDEYINGNTNLLSTVYSKEFKTIDKNSHLLIIKISNIEQNLNCIDNLNISLSNLDIVKQNNKIQNKNGEWNFNIELNENNFENLEVCKYIIEENDYIENYEIKENNIGISVQLEFKDLFSKYDVIEKNNIYIETKDGNKIMCRDYYRVKNNIVNFYIPLENKINEFKIILKVNNEELIFNVKKENS